MNTAAADFQKEAGLEYINLAFQTIPAEMAECLRNAEKAGQIFCGLKDAAPFTISSRGIKHGEFLFVGTRYAAQRDERTDRVVMHEIEKLDTLPVAGFQGSVCYDLRGQGRVFMLTKEALTAALAGKVRDSEKVVPGLVVGHHDDHTYIKTGAGFSRFPTELFPASAWLQGKQISADLRVGIEEAGQVANQHSAALAM
jgi:hypothetical protein